jgi:hypothetical protein
VIKKIYQRLLWIALQRLTVLSLCASLLSLSLPFGGHATAGPAPKLKSESQLRSEAALYDGAIREIERIANLKLAVPEESKKAQAILDKQVPNLRFSRSKLVALGLSDASFASAIKAKAPDKKAADPFAQELARDNKAILKLSGAQSLADRIRKSVAEDTAKLRRIAELLKQAGAEIRAKKHHAVKANSSAPDFVGGRDVFASARPSSPPDSVSDTLVTVLVIAVAVIVVPPCLWRSWTLPVRLTLASLRQASSMRREKS